MKKLLSVISFLILFGCSNTLSVVGKNGHYEIKENLINIHKSTISLFAYEKDNLTLVGSAVYIKRVKGKQPLILTAAHVIAGIEKKQDQFLNTIFYGSIRNKKMAAGIVIYRDDIRDLAVIQGIKEEKITGHYAPIAKENPKLGDEIWIIGSPMGIEGNITKGILSNILWDTKVIHYRMNAELFFGNSGGGVFNKDQELVGIVSSVEGFIPNIPVPVPGGGRAIGLYHILEVLKRIKYEKN